MVSGQHNLAAPTAVLGWVVLVLLRSNDSVMMIKKKMNDQE